VATSVLEGRTVTDERSILLIGGAGVVGQVIRSRLPATFVVLDLQERMDRLPYERWITGSVSDPYVVSQAVEGVDAIVHLATGASDWEGLLQADMLGLKSVGEAAVAAGVPRLVYASTNHTVGMVEREAHAHGKGLPYPVDAPVRPDSLYGVAKSFGEALCRYFAETTPLSTSCLRIGTVRLDDDPDTCAKEPYFDYVPGGRSAVQQRLKRTWLYHDDLVRILDEELDASDKFRLRFAFSDPEDPYWSTDVLRWSPRTQ
jgi:nucleoside-diphosphate-sugar epimerase